MRKIIYRRQLLRAVEAFLEGTPSSHVRALQIIKRCRAALSTEGKENTVDKIIWGPLLSALTDFVVYESKPYLQEKREMLQGQTSQSTNRIALKCDFREDFTTEEAEWYEHLLSMLTFIESIPFARLHEAAFPVWRQKGGWEKARNHIPEAEQVEEIEAEHKRRKAQIEMQAAKFPVRENVGDEKVYHLVLREVTAWIIELRLGMSAVVYGYPFLDPPYPYTEVVSAPPSKGPLDMSENVKWAKRALDALAGKGILLLSLRLDKAPTFGIDVLTLSF